MVSSKELSSKRDKCYVIKFSTILPLQKQAINIQTTVEWRHNSHACRDLLTMRPNEVVSSSNTY